MSESLASKNLMEGLTALFNKLGYDVKVVTHIPEPEKTDEDEVKTSELLEKLSAKFSQLAAEIDNKVTEWHKEIDDLKEQVYQLWNIAKINEKEQEREAIKPAEPAKQPVKEESSEDLSDLLKLVATLLR